MIGALRKIITRGWHSPTLTTWSASAARLMMLVAVLPLVLGTFSVEEIRFWFILNGLLILNLLCDTGFSPTFARVYAYAMGGAKVSDLGDQNLTEKRSSREPNWETIHVVSGVCQRIYFVLALVYLVLLGTFGTWSVVAVIPKLPDPQAGWLAWLVMVIVQPIAFYDKKYGCYLAGTNLIALNQRYAALIAILTAVFLVVSLLLGGGVMTLVIITQVSALVAFLKSYLLVRYVHGGKYRDSFLGRKDLRVWGAIWPRAWKSALGHISLMGATQISGIIYARGADASAGALYLLALRLVNTISQFADAPLYSKIPMLSRLRSEGDLETLTRVAQRGMRLALIVFVVGILSLGLVGPVVFDYIGKDVGFPPLGLWLLLGIAMFFGRFGAMHLQIFTTTNKVLWHWIGAAAGSAFVLTAYLLMPKLDYYAFPIGLLVGYGLVYFPWSVTLSYRSLHISMWRFDRTVGIPALVILLMGSTIIWWRHISFSTL